MDKGVQTSIHEHFLPNLKEIGEIDVCIKASVIMLSKPDDSPRMKEK